VRCRSPRCWPTAGAGRIGQPVARRLRGARSAQGARARLGWAPTSAVAFRELRKPERLEPRAGRLSAPVTVPGLLDDGQYVTADGRDRDRRARARPPASWSPSTPGRDAGQPQRRRGAARRLVFLPWPTSSWTVGRRDGMSAASAPEPASGRPGSRYRCLLHGAPRALPALTDSVIRELIGRGHTVRWSSNARGRQGRSSGLAARMERHPSFSWSHTLPGAATVVPRRAAGAAR
jgi:hypothetical protein